MFSSMEGDNNEYELRSVELKAVACTLRSISDL